MATSSFRIAAVVVASLTMLGAPVLAKKKPTQHVLVLEEVNLPKDAPQALKLTIRSILTKAIAGEPNLMASLPSDAPTIDYSDRGLQGNKAFRKYMKKHNLKAYHVRVQVAAFVQVTKVDPNKAGHIIETSVQLRMFGETIPERVMAFTGAGSAKIVAEVGKKVRERDTQFATHDALEIALTGALQTSIKKMNVNKPQQKRRRKSRR